MAGRLVLVSDGRTDLSCVRFTVELPSVVELRFCDPCWTARLLLAVVEGVVFALFVTPVFGVRVVLGVEPPPTRPFVSCAVNTKLEKLASMITKRSLLISRYQVWVRQYVNKSTTPET